MDRSPTTAVLFAGIFSLVASAPTSAQMRTEAVEAGPIWNTADADQKCLALAHREGGLWTLGWWTTVEGRMSVCQLALPQAQPVEAGPIWNSADADQKCRALANREGGRWTGGWWTTVQGRMSVCEIAQPKKQPVEAGPIWNGADANQKCPVLARREGGRWTGGWWTTVQGRMSVCEIALPPTHPVDAGPIWSGADADQKCPALANRVGGRWTGGWWTTVQGQVSVCEIALRSWP